MNETLISFSQEKKCEMYFWGKKVPFKLTENEFSKISTKKGGSIHFLMLMILYWNTLANVDHVLK